MDITRKINHASSYAVVAYEVAVKVILSLIIIVLLATMSWMVLKFIFELKSLLEGSIKELSKTVIVNVLMILATLRFLELRWHISLKGG